MYVFTVRIADADRNVYESLTLRDSPAAVGGGRVFGYAGAGILLGVCGRDHFLQGLV